MTQKISDNERHQITHRVTVVGTIIDVLLTVVKLFVGFIAGSTALIADGLHSFSDLLTDVAILFIAKVSAQEADEDHPYGHARYETMGTVLLGTVLFMVAIGIGWDATISFFEGQKAGGIYWLAILVAAASLFSKEWLFQYQNNWAKKIDSNLLAANAWHSRSDALSSGVVLVGIFFSLIGFTWVEAAAALFVALLIAKMGIKLAWDAMQDLVDRGVPPEKQEAIAQTIRSVQGVVSVHLLRTRLMGNSIYVDVHIQVDNRISVSEGHQIGDWVSHHIHKQHRDIQDITVHVDAEDDLLIPKNVIAPLRAEVADELKKYSVLREYDHFQLHYFQQRIYLELFLKNAPEPAHFDQLSSLLENNDWLIDCKILQIHSKSD